MSRRAILLIVGALACTAPEVPPVPVAVAPLPLDAPWVDPKLPDAKPGRYALRELRIAWTGADGVWGDVTRSEPEARILARQIERRLAAGEAFSVIANRLSDAPTRQRGGWIGAFESGTFDPKIEASIASVEIGALSPTVRTTAGYHLLQRVPLDEVIVSYALVAWRSARGATVTRDKASAAFLAGEAAAALRGGTLASALKADRGSGAEGVLVGRDQWAPAVEQVAFSLKVGAVSDPIDTPEGFLVLRRLR